MTCLKIDKLCRKCKWNIPDSTIDGIHDKCSHPNVFWKEGERKPDQATCYISGIMKNEKNAKFSEWCEHQRFVFDDGHNIPGTDICGKSGEWFEPKIESALDKPWWQRLIWWH